MYTCMVSDDGGNNYGEVSVQLIVLGACHVPGAPILRQCWGAGGGVAVLLGKAQPLTRGNAERALREGGVSGGRGPASGLQAPP